MKNLYIVNVVLVLYIICMTIFFCNRLEYCNTCMVLLKQSNDERIEETEVFRNKCKMLEEILHENGIELDNCECN